MVFLKFKDFKVKEHSTTIFRRIVQIIAFFIINYVIFELIFLINLLSLEALLKVLPILNSPRNPLSTGAGILEFIFFFMVEGQLPFYLIGVLILILLFTNRFFCGWICPIGTIQDICAAFPTKKRMVKTSVHKSLLKIKYVIVILLLIIIVPLPFTRAANLSFYLDYKDNIGDFGKKPMGFFSLSEYIFYFFPNIVMEVFETGSLAPIFGGAKFNFLVFFMFFFYAILIVLSVWYPRVYCRYFCPFAAVSSVVSEFSFLKLSRSPVLCVGRSECGICERKCPKQIRILDEPFEFFTGNGECNFCLKCKELCPYDAIEIKFG